MVKTIKLRNLCFVWVPLGSDPQRRKQGRIIYLEGAVSMSREIQKLKKKKGRKKVKAANRVCY